MSFPLKGNTSINPASPNPIVIGNKAIKNFKQRNLVETYAAGSGTGGWQAANPGTVTTWQQIIASRGKPYAIRVGYYNPLTTSYTVDKTTIAPSATYVSSTPMDPTGTAINVTFASSTSVVVPAASSAGVDGFVKSDWIPVVPVDRTDVVGSFYLWYLRSLINQTSGFVYGSSGAGGPSYPGNVPNGIIRQANFNPSDRVTNPVGFTGGITSGGNPGFHIPLSLEFKGLANAARLIVVGDSIDAGGNTGAGSGAEFYGYGEIAVDLVNNASGPQGRFISFQNFGVGSQGLNTFYARLVNILAAYPADYVMFPAWSPNSAPITQAAFDDSLNRVLDAIYNTINSNAVPILRTSPPFASGSPTVEIYRLKMNAAIRSMAATMGIVVIDFDALVSNNATPVANWLPGMSSDGGTHQSYAAQQLFAQALATVLPQISIG